MIDDASLRQVERRFIARATESGDGEAVIRAFCEDLLAAGLPIWQVSLDVPNLDPIYRYTHVVWRRGEGIRVGLISHDADHDAETTGAGAWLRARGGTDGRWRLDEAAARSDIPALARLASEGATEYLMRLIALEPDMPMSGIDVSFATDRPGGFAEVERVGLLDMAPLIALVTSKLTLGYTLREALSTYIGAAAGNRVLRGAMRRGQGQLVSAAILLVDLRGFTALADREDPMRLVGWLDEHFDALAEPVMRRKGEVSKFLGDGFLAVFPAAAPGTAAAACGSALEAACEALARNEALNNARRAGGAPAMAADVALHYGTVVVGNIGTGRRLDFTIVGSPVNEAARIELLCEQIGAPLLMSDAFAEHCATELVERGCYEVRGVGRRLRIWTLPPRAAGDVRE